MNLSITQTVSQIYPYAGLYIQNALGRPFKVDGQNRITLPSELAIVLKSRKRLRDPDSKILLIYLTTMVQNEVPYLVITDTPCEAGVDMDKTFPDKMSDRNRVYVPRFMEDAQLKKEVVFQGCTSHISIYSRENWDTYLSRK